MKKCNRIIAASFLLVLFLASPLFDYAVGSLPLSKEQIADLREEYPLIHMENPFADYYTARCFSRSAQKADTLIWCDVTDYTTVPISGSTAYIVRIIDDSRNLFVKGSSLELRRGSSCLKREIEPGEQFAVPIVCFEDRERPFSLIDSEEMFYVTESGYVLSVFDESNGWINYDKKVHSGMSVHTLLRKYIAWDGVPEALDFETMEEAEEWLRQRGYYPYEY